MRSKFSGFHAFLNIVTLCLEYVCTCHDMTLYGRVTLLVHTGERIRVWCGRVSHGIFTEAYLWIDVSINDLEKAVELQRCGVPGCGVLGCCEAATQGEWQQGAAVPGRRRSLRSRPAAMSTTGEVARGAGVQVVVVVPAAASTMLLWRQR